uniref:(northern house mosquito) hypothetical protein n=1 Tax=Culex pipiens TaxID=7175 RepID=A0A8D8FYL5_CULPI
MAHQMKDIFLNSLKLKILPDLCTTSSASRRRPRRTRSSHRRRSTRGESNAGSDIRPRRTSNGDSKRRRSGSAGASGLRRTSADLLTGTSSSSKNLRGRVVAAVQGTFETKVDGGGRNSSRERSMHQLRRVWKMEKMRSELGLKELPV